MSDGEAVELAATVPTPTEEDTLPRYRWVIIAQLWAQMPLEFLFGAALGVLLPVIRRDISMTSSEMGWLGSVNAVSRILMLPTSPLLVRFPPKHTLAVFLGLVASLLLILSQVDSLLFFISVLFTYSACISFTAVPSQLLRFQWIPPRQMATVLGVGMGFSAVVQSLSFMVIPQLLAVPLHWRQIAQGLGVAVLMLAGLWAATGREHDTPRYRQGMAGTTGLGALRGVLRRREFVFLGLAMMGGASAYMTALLFLPVYLVDEGGQSLATAGMVVSLIPLGGMVATFSGGFLSDLIGLRRPFMWPAGLALPFLYLAVLSLDQPVLLAVAGFALGYVAWAPFPVLMAIPFELPGIRPSEVAVGQTLIGAIGTLGQSIAPLITGYVAQAMGSLRAGILALSVWPVLFLLGLLLPETGPKKAGRKPELPPPEAGKT